MNKETTSEAKPILVFNKSKILIGIFKSVHEAAKYGGQGTGNVSRACKGTLISLNKYYFRYIDNNVEIELSDIGNLQLEEYDELCGIERPVYATRNMNRKNWKYKTQKSEDNENQNL